MGNPTSDGAPVVGAAIHTFFSAQSWIEGAVIDQLRQVAALAGVEQIAAFPDLHPGKYGPVGCAIAADRVYPQLIGNDIGCGMSLFMLDLPVRKIRPDKAAQRLRGLEGPWDGNADLLLEQQGFSGDCFAESLGTVGGGNHFCELQAIADMFDADTVNACGLDQDLALLLVHSGSRGFGMQVFARVQAHMAGLVRDQAECVAYIDNHAAAVRWASLNREVIAIRAARALRADLRLIADAPHNLIEQRGDMVLHRKGAAKADMPLVPLAGSRDSLSYMLSPNLAAGTALSSLAHGSGRKYDRKSMTGRVGATRSQREQLLRTSFGGHVVCDDRQLLIEEAPSAYKPSGQVLDDLVEFDLARPVASLRPLVTFKRALADQRDASSRRRKNDRTHARRRP